MAESYLEKLKKEYGDIFGGATPPIASSEYTRISGEYDEYDKTERPGDITKFVSAEAPSTGPVGTPRTLYSPYKKDRPPPEPYEKTSYGEKFDKKHPGRREKVSDIRYLYGEEKGGKNVNKISLYKPEKGYEKGYKLYDGYGRPMAIGSKGVWMPAELAKLQYEFLEIRHDRSEDRLADERDTAIAEYWDKVDSHTKKIEDYIKSSGITAEEYSKRSTAAAPLKLEYVKDHPDYPLERPWSAPPSDPEKAIAEALAPVKLEIGRDTVDDLESSISTATVEAARILEDMGLIPTGEGAPDYLGTVIKDRDGGYGVKSPGLGLGGDTGFASGEAYRDVLEHALGAATVGEPAMDAREHYLALTGEESVDPMDLATHAAVAGLSPTEAARAVTGEAVRRIVDPSAPYASARSPEVLETKFEDAFGSSKLDSERLPISFTAGMGHEAEREAYLSRGSDIPSGISSGIDDFSSMPLDPATRARIDADMAAGIFPEVASSVGMVEGPGGVWEYVAPKGITDAGFRPSGLAKFGLGAGSLAGGLMAHSEPLGVSSDIPLVPYSDPYPGMIDPTFEPTATTHYDDILKHFETEAVPGHLPMDITDTPAYAEIMGEPYKYDPVMPPPSAYSRPDMELDLATRALIDSDMGMARATLGDPGYVDPYPGVDDFSGIIPSGIPSYMKKDAGGVLHDTRSFGYMPPGYDWRTGTFAGGSEGPYAGGSSASMSDEEMLVEALERMASIPAGFVGGPEREITYIDATGGPTARFGGVGDIGGGGGTVTSPLTGVGGFYAPISPYTGITAPDPLATIWT